MSSAYYAKVKADGGMLSKISNEKDVLETDESYDDANIFGDLRENLSPARKSTKPSPRREKGHPDLEARSQKTAAAVSQMRDRLAAMGILQEPGVEIDTLEKMDPPGSPVRNINAKSLKMAAASNAHAKQSEGNRTGHDSEPPPPYITAEENVEKTGEAIDRMRENLRDMGILIEDNGDNETESTVSVDKTEDIDDATKVLLEEKAKNCSKLLS